MSHLDAVLFVHSSLADSTTPRFGLVESEAIQPLEPPKCRIRSQQLSIEEFGRPILDGSTDNEMKDVPSWFYDKSSVTTAKA